MQRSALYAAVGAKAKQLLPARDALDAATTAEANAASLLRLHSFRAIPPEDTGKGDSGTDSGKQDQRSLAQIAAACDAYCIWDVLVHKGVHSATAVDAVDQCLSAEGGVLLRYITKVSLALAPNPGKLSKKALHSIASDLGLVFQPRIASERLLTLAHCPVHEVLQHESASRSGGSTSVPVQQLTHSVCCKAITRSLPKELAITCTRTIAQQDDQCIIIAALKP